MTDQGTITPPKRKNKPWGHESEFTRKLREKSLENIIITGCLICGVSVTRTARAGIEWFRDHQETARHKRNIAKRRNGH